LDFLSFGILIEGNSMTIIRKTEGSGHQTRRLRIPDIAWIEIPGGPFIYQDGERRELPTFWIAKYPITNAQFQTFVDDGGYGEDRWWQDLRKPEPQEPPWKQSNRPRTDVDWYEAVAFTRWLSNRLGLAEGILRLPTEYEWEKAARGEKGLLYPWGNEYRSGFANIDETERKDGRWYLEQTTAVGMYPHGQSPFGVEDLAGNVWEWCLNKYDKPDEVSADTRGDGRGLRGGSWLYNSEYARAATRLWSLPGLRHDHRGFRVLSSVPIAVR
jgi:formylglycine-generating enzyme required for sulfatase activity